MNLFERRRLLLAACGDKKFYIYKSGDSSVEATISQNRRTFNADHLLLWKYSDLIAHVEDITQYHTLNFELAFSSAVTEPAYIGYSNNSSEIMNGALSGTRKKDITSTERTVYSFDITAADAGYNYIKILNDKEGGYTLKIYNIWLE